MTIKRIIAYLGCVLVCMEDISWKVWMHLKVQLGTRACSQNLLFHVAALCQGRGSLVAAGLCLCVCMFSQRWTKRLKSRCSCRSWLFLFTHGACAIVPEWREVQSLLLSNLHNLEWEKRGEGGGGCAVFIVLLHPVAHIHTHTCRRTAYQHTRGRHIHIGICNRKRERGR